MKVALIDNDRIVLNVLQKIISARIFGAEILWSASTGRRALSLFEETQEKPDVVLVDMSMEDMSGIEICRRIREQTETVYLIAITAFAKEKYAAEVAQAGAQGIVDKADIRRICAVIQDIHAGKNLCTFSTIPFLSPHEAFKHMVSMKHSLKETKLTSRETEIMNICSAGYTLKEASNILQISQSTTKTHMQNAIKKLHVQNKMQAIAKWTRMQ